LLATSPFFKNEPKVKVMHVVAEPCSGCKYTDCVVVCPVECFYEGEKMLYIHPEECIDCEACVPECPVEAIFHEDNLPEEWKHYIEINAVESEKCEVITEKQEPLADN
jgi:ferredoxin